MTTMLHPTTAFATRHHHPATTGAFVLLFWLLAAIAVTSAHVALGRSPIACAVVTLAIIVIAAFAYIRTVTRCCGVTHALGVGIAWLVLSIIVEIAVTTHLHHGWFSLLGSPDHPLLRNLHLFAWIFAPAFFAQRENEDR